MSEKFFLPTEDWIKNLCYGDMVPDPFNGKPAEVANIYWVDPSGSEAEVSVYVNIELPGSKVICQAMPVLYRAGRLHMTSELASCYTVAEIHQIEKSLIDGLRGHIA